MDATECVAHAKALKMSPIALFWLQAKASLLQLSHFGRLLQREFPGGFDRGMRAALMKVEPVSTECYVVRYTKKEALEGFEALLRRRGEDDIPVMPFMFQTANGSSFKGSLFFVFKTAEDALHRIRRIAVERCYRGDGIFSPPVAFLTLVCSICFADRLFRRSRRSTSTSPAIPSASRSSSSTARRTSGTLRARRAWTRPPLTR